MGAIRLSIPITGEFIGQLIEHAETSQSVNIDSSKETSITISASMDLVLTKERRNQGLLRRPLGY